MIIVMLIELRIEYPSSISDMGLPNTICKQFIPY
mgnify:CR=1 FL=1